MRPETRQAKMAVMVEQASNIAAETGSTEILDWLKAYSFYDIRMYAIAESAVRGNCVNVLEWCNDNDVYFEYRCKNHLTLLGWALFIGSMECAMWIFRNIGPRVGDVVYVIDEIGMQLPFSPLLCEILLELNMGKSVISAVPRLVHNYRGYHAYLCGAYCAQHPSMVSKVRLRGVDRYAPRLKPSSKMAESKIKFFEALSFTYAQQKREHDAWLAVSGMARRRGVPMEVWKNVYQFARGKENRWHSARLHEEATEISIILDSSREEKKKIKSNNLFC